MSLEEKGQNFIQRFLDNHGNTKIGEISSVTLYCFSS